MSLPVAPPRFSRRYYRHNRAETKLSVVRMVTRHDRLVLLRMALPDTPGSGTAVRRCLWPRLRHLICGHSGTGSAPITIRGARPLVWGGRARYKTVLTRPPLGGLAFELRGRPLRSGPVWAGVRPPAFPTDAIQEARGPLSRGTTLVSIVGARVSVVRIRLATSSASTARLPHPTGV